ncbi:MAG: methyltransferase domain-containing protein [Bacteroidetes bacterium]|nr:methyltransferase domain-containing protein [Bacteroidota bacterium]
MVSAKSKDPWYKLWFDSPYYHKLYKNRNEKEAERFIDRLVEYFSPPDDAKILDAACGQGRHAKYLSAKGYEVTGIDLAASNIEFAKQFESERLKFFKHELTHSFKRLYFNYIFNFFTSFGYYNTEDENIKVLQMFNYDTAPFGFLMIDFMNTTKAIAELVSSETKKVDDVEFKIERKLSGDTIIKTIEVVDEKKYSFEERVKALRRADFERYLKESNYHIKEMFGSYQLESFNEQDSDRLIIIAQKLR